MKKFMIATGTGIFLLLGILIRLLAVEDKTGPVITFAEASVAYTEDEPKDTLLKNVSAKDAEDGDVTDTVMVENILPMLDSSTAKITYVAKDSNNNITKKEVIVPYTPKNTGNLGNKTTGVQAQSESGRAETQNSPESTNGTEANQETSGLQGSNQVNVTEEYQGMNPSGNTGSPVTTGPALNQTGTSGSLKYPALTLKTHEVQLKRGSRFGALSYVDDIVDDKDNYYAMFQRIHIIGYFDMDKAGDYVLLYYAIDSDNNESDKEYLWIDVR